MPSRLRRWFGLDRFDAIAARVAMLDAGMTRTHAHPEVEAAINAQRIEAVKDLHTPVQMVTPYSICSEDGQEWPCLTALALNRAGGETR